MKPPIITPLDAAYGSRCERKRRYTAPFPTHGSLMEQCLGEATHLVTWEGSEGLHVLRMCPQCTEDYRGFKF